MSNRFFQLVRIAEDELTNLTLNKRPNAVMKLIHIRGLWRTKIFRPEIHVRLQSLLDDFSGVGRYSILLKAIISLFGNPFHQLKYFELQNVLGIYCN